MSEGWIFLNTYYHIHTDLTLDDRLLQNVCHVWCLRFGFPTLLLAFSHVIKYSPILIITKETWIHFFLLSPLWSRCCYFYRWGNWSPQFSSLSEVSLPYRSLPRNFSPEQNSSENWLWASCPVKPQGLQSSPSPSEAPFLQSCSFPSLSPLSPPKIVTYVLTSVGFSLIYDLCPSQVGIFLIDSVNPADLRCVLLEFWFTFSQKLKPCHKAEVTCELNRILSYVLERGHLRNTLFILKENKVWI